MSFETTQYNKVQKPYDDLRKATIAIVERVNVREIVLPLIKDATVLDLACGTGFHSRSFLDWGAKAVVGVDISSVMLEEARALSQTYGSRISFIEADGSKPFAFPGGPFDVVFGGWFLNYAPTLASLVDFYRNIMVNLKPGGHYVGVSPPPTHDPTSHIEREQQLRPPPTASGGLYTTVVGSVKDGVHIHRHSDTPSGDLDFECYHLEKHVWEAAARDAGFENDIQWSATNIPADFMEHPEKYGEPSSGEAGSEELGTYAQLPLYGLLLLQK